MTAEHDGRAEHAGMDALMAALTDEPLSDAARADAAFMAEHRSAEADLALLREQLGIIGRTLAEPPEAAEAPAPVLVRPSRTRRRVLNLAFGGLAVAAAAAVLSGMAWLLAQAEGGMNGQTSSDSGAAKEAEEQDGAGTLFGSPRYFACSSLIAEGRATSVVQIPGTESVRLTVDVTRYYKPERSAEGDAKELTYVIDTHVIPGLRQGDHVLWGIPDGERQPDYWLVGEKQIAKDRARLIVSAAESRGLTCE